MFQNRKLIIATKHRKEKVIAPILEKELGVSCFVDENFDTDALGTFTGEIERKLDPIATVREKCLRAMALNQCDLGVASEGSFGPHPNIFFASADDEFLIFIDKKNNLEIITRELSVSTNFDGKQIQSEEALMDFASQVQFPSHALILRKSKDANEDIHKGITDVQHLKQAFQELSTKYHSVYAETDMRAHFNPTRMEVIKNATHKLVDKIRSKCPQCQTPGFGIKEAKKGLKCGLCALPTNAIISYIYECHACNFQKEEWYPHNKTEEDPTYCDHCNP